jgi:transglutaminase-like putative cysteine protease
MRFGFVHRVMTDALAALGVLAVVSTASLDPWTNGFLLVGLVLALALPERWQTKPALRHFATIAPLALFMIQTLRLVLGRPALDVAVEFAALLQIVRLATRRGAAHDQQIVVLALLHLVAGTVLGGGITYGLCFLGFLVVAPGALVLSHLRREVEGNYRQGARDRTGLPVDVPRILRSRRVVGRGFLLSTCLLSVPILFFTATLFILFPRVGLSLLLLNHPRQGRMVGFSDHVDLGEVGVLRTDPSIALRFDVPELPEPAPPRLTLRLRGTAFDYYDGRAWSRTIVERRVAERSPLANDLYPIVRMPDPSKDRRISFDLEPIDPPVIFLPPRTVGLRVRAPSPLAQADPLLVQRGPEGEMRYGGADARGLRYEAFLAADDEAPTELLQPGEHARYLQLPPGLPPRVGDLAREWTQGITGDYAKARVIEDHLKKTYRYDLASPSGGTPQPVDHFLFDSHRGHCEFFSTSLAVMLRAVGIPARNVTGFVGGTYNRFGRYYAVREGDAHSWVEAYVEDGVRPGWVTLDATPAAGAQPLHQTTGAFVYMRDFVEALSQRWNRYVIGYDLRTQARLFDDVARGYEAFRSRRGLNQGTIDKLTRAPALAGGVIVLAGVGYLVWRRRKRITIFDKSAPQPPPIDRNVENIAALYRALEAALAPHGVYRPASMPPLRHAEGLSEQNHPLGPQVLELTKVYIEARFGGLLLGEDQRKDFERRVREIRAMKPLPQEGLDDALA